VVAKKDDESPRSWRKSAGATTRLRRNEWFPRD
jgi:hypothetical protein